MPETATMYTYPWDLHDEGVEYALDVIAGTARVNSICLALSYHIATYFLPHNPRRKLYYGEHGTVYFRPQADLYRGTRIRAQVSHVVEGDDYIHRIREQARKRGLEFSAWIVYFYNHYLAGTYPECAKIDAFGSPYPSMLCPANPDVREYAAALTHDIMANYAPETVNLESLSYLHFEYGFLNPKVIVEVSPYHRFLLGLCFCPHCVEAAAKDGLDGARLKSGVAELLEHALSSNPRSGDSPAPSPELLDSAFDGDLRRYLDVREKTALSLFERIVGIVRSYSDARIQMVMPEKSSGIVRGLPSEKIIPLFDRTLVFPPDSGLDLSSFVAEQRAAMRAQTELLLLAQPENLRDAAHALRLFEAWCSAGGNGFGFYNYGLMRREHLEWIGSGRHLWED